MEKENVFGITKDMIIADCVKRYPATEKVFMEFFGHGCRTCPGSKREDIYYGSKMHNVSVDAVLKALNCAIKK
ncbi:MAG: DUF1858 domain-containing protein [Deltaproteobacteria bacterium]|nr:DUF1858 domain-containing protein [Deltaproteobacteria bacterium]